MLFHYGDWLTDDLWADPNRGPINSLLDEINAQLVALKSEMDYIKEQAGKNGTTGNIGNVMDALGKDITKCETAVENALSSTSETQQKEELAEIRATISAWLAEKDETNKKDGGLFIQLKELCESHLKKEISANVLSTLEIYEETLSNLVTKIDELIGT